MFGDNRSSDVVPKRHNNLIPDFKEHDDKNLNRNGSVGTHELLDLNMKIDIKENNLNKGEYDTYKNNDRKVCRYLNVNDTSSSSTGGFDFQPKNYKKPSSNSPENLESTTVPPLGIETPQSVNIENLSPEYVSKLESTVMKDEKNSTTESQFCPLEKASLTKLKNGDSRISSILCNMKSDIHNGEIGSTFYKLSDNNRKLLPHDKTAPNAKYSNLYSNLGDFRTKSLFIETKGLILSYKDSFLDNEDFIDKIDCFSDTFSDGDVISDIISTSSKTGSCNSFDVDNHIILNSSSDHVDAPNTHENKKTTKYNNSTDATHIDTTNTPKLNIPSIIVDPKFSFNIIQSSIDKSFNISSNDVDNTDNKQVFEPKNSQVDTATKELHDVLIKELNLDLYNVTNSQTKQLCQRSHSLAYPGTLVEPSFSNDSILLIKKATDENIDCTSRVLRIFKSILNSKSNNDAQKVDGSNKYNEVSKVSDNSHIQHKKVVFEDGESQKETLDQDKLVNDNVFFVSSEKETDDNAINEILNLPVENLNIPVKENHLDAKGDSYDDVETAEKNLKELNIDKYISLNLLNTKLNTNSLYCSNSNEEHLDDTIHSTTSTTTSSVKYLSPTPIYTKNDSDNEPAKLCDKNVGTTSSETEKNLLNKPCDVNKFPKIDINERSTSRMRPSECDLILSIDSNNVSDKEKTVRIHKFAETPNFKYSDYENAKISNSEISEEMKLDEAQQLIEGQKLIERQEISIIRKFVGIWDSFRVKKSSMKTPNNECDTEFETPTEYYELEEANETPLESFELQEKIELSEEQPEEEVQETTLNKFEELRGFEEHIEPHQTLVEPVKQPKFQEATTELFKSFNEHARQPEIQEQLESNKCIDVLEKQIQQKDRDALVEQDEDKSIIDIQKCDESQNNLEYLENQSIIDTQDCEEFQSEVDYLEKQPVIEIQKRVESRNIPEHLETQRHIIEIQERVESRELIGSDETDENQIDLDNDDSSSSITKQSICTVSIYDASQLDENQIYSDNIAIPVYVEELENQLEVLDSVQEFEPVVEEVKDDSYYNSFPLSSRDESLKAMRQPVLLDPKPYKVQNIEDVTNSKLKEPTEKKNISVSQSLILPTPSSSTYTQKGSSVIESKHAVVAVLRKHVLEAQKYIGGSQIYFSQKPDEASVKKCISETIDYLKDGDNFIRLGTKKNKIKPDIGLITDCSMLVINNLILIKKEHREAYCKLAIGALKKASLMNSADAQYWLGNIYISGISCPPENVIVRPKHVKGFNYYVSASKQNHTEALFHLGLCYEEGVGVAKSYAKALANYKKSALSNHPGAMFRLGICLIRGELRQQKKPKEGVKWLRLAVRYSTEKYPHAVYQLAMLHEKGFSNVIWVDHAYLVQLLAKAASLNHVESQYLLGETYEYGNYGVEPDPGKSVYYYSLAALNGCSEAMLELGGWHLTGAYDPRTNFNIPKSESQALGWVRLSANANHPRGMYTLAYFYEIGIGCNVDMTKCKYWYNSAAKAGDLRAIERIRRGFSTDVNKQEALNANVSAAAIHDSLFSRPCSQAHHNISHGLNTGLLNRKFSKSEPNINKISASGLNITARNTNSVKLKRKNNYTDDLECKSYDKVDILSKENISDFTNRSYDNDVFNEKSNMYNMIKKDHVLKIDIHPTPSPPLTESVAPDYSVRSCDSTDETMSTSEKTQISLNSVGQNNIRRSLMTTNKYNNLIMISPKSNEININDSSTKKKRIVLQNQV